MHRTSHKPSTIHHSSEGVKNTNTLTPIEQSWQLELTGDKRGLLLLLERCPPYHPSTFHHNSERVMRETSGEGLGTKENRANQRSWH